tara:strand:+ start:483 stop:797 length:315 start_codon:yes stop_codon:yes gene_type:complete
MNQKTVPAEMKLPLVNSFLNSLCTSPLLLVLFSLLLILLFPSSPKLHFPSLSFSVYFFFLLRVGTLQIFAVLSMEQVANMLESGDQVIPVILSALPKNKVDNGK